MVTILKDVRKGTTEAWKTGCPDWPPALETVQLDGGTLCVRPRGELGTCGWHPRPWQLAVVEAGEPPLEAFLAANPRWVKLEPLPAPNELAAFDEGGFA